MVRLWPESRARVLGRCDGAAQEEQRTKLRARPFPLAPTTVPEPKTHAPFREYVGAAAD